MDSDLEDLLQLRTAEAEAALQALAEVEEQKRARAQEQVSSSEAASNANPGPGKASTRASSHGDHDDSNVVVGSGWAGTDKPPSTLEEWVQDDYVPAMPPGSPTATYNCPKCKAMYDAYLERGEGSLAARTHLEDTSFYEEPQSLVDIRYRTLYCILCAAYRVAQNSWWNVVRQHWPQILVDVYFQGPRTVQFESNALKRLFNPHLTAPRTHADLCEGPNLNMQTVLFDVAYLENAISHPNTDFDYMSLERADGVMRSAQSLAVLLQDEKSALKIRALRDELQRYAREAYDRIVQLEPQYHGPGAPTWATHHQHTFKRAREREGRLLQWGDPAIMRAARAWDVVYHGRPGIADSAIVANESRNDRHFQNLVGPDISRYTGRAYHGPHIPQAAAALLVVPATHAASASHAASAPDVAWRRASADF